MNETPRSNKIALASSLALFGAAAWRVVDVAQLQLLAPFDLISEGPHLTTVKAIREGFNIYDPSSYRGLPFFLTPYVPLYHLLVALFPPSPTNPFLVGRLVSMAFMMGAASCLVVTGARRARLGIPLAAIAAFFLVRTVAANTPYMRSDAAALFFSAAAIVSVGGAERRWLRVVLTALLCALAIAAKQPYVAATGTCLLYLVLRDRRSTLVFLTAILAFGSMLSAAAWAHWGNGFWFCVTLPLAHYPRDWPTFYEHWHQMLRQPVFVYIVGLTGILLFGSMLSRTHRATLDVRSPFFIYMLASWPAHIIALSGIGASTHYFFEPILASLMWTSAFVGAMPVAPLLTWRLTAALVVLGACAVLELLGPAREERSYTTVLRSQRYVEDRDQVSRALAGLGLEHGVMLNFKNSQVTHDFQGQMNMNDPYLFGILWETGTFNIEPLRRAISERYFDAILVAPGIVSADGQDGDNPSQEIIRTLFRHYKLAIHGEEVNVLTRIDR